MAGELVLITGATGHIGFRTLVEALRAGYRVRAAIRRKSAAETIKNTASVKPYVDNLEFAIVPDITADGAFDEALTGAVYALHIASPLAIPTDNYQRDIIEPALHGTLSILTSALKSPTLKRIVITSSNAVIGPRDETTMASKIFTEKDIGPVPQAPYANSFAAYAASKSIAHAAEDRFMEEHRPGFSLVRILPGFVVGRNELATTVESFNAGTNKLIFAPILGGTYPGPLAGATVHVDDVARAHVDALDTEKVVGNQDFLADSNCPEGITWEDSAEITRKAFPEAVRKGLLPLGGTQPTKRVRYDASKTERVFGWRFKGFEEQVKSAVAQWLELNGEVAA